MCFRNISQVKENYLAANALSCFLGKLEVFSQRVGEVEHVVFQQRKKKRPQGTVNCLFFTIIITIIIMFGKNDDDS